MAKIIVSTAVLWLTLNIKVKEIFSRLGASEARPDDMSSAFGTLDSGIQYSDRVESADNVVRNINDQPLPESGDVVIVVAKLFYNGLQLNKDASSEVLQFSCTYKDDLDAKKGLNYSFERAVPASRNKTKSNRKTGASGSDSASDSEDTESLALSAVVASLEGLRYGVVRKVVVPAPLAFGDRGLSPFVPPGAPVMYELTMSKKR
jgi:hypothetical protein